MSIKDFDNQKINLVKKTVIKNIIEMAYKAGSSSAHIGGALSIVDIISVLFEYFVNLNKKNINQHIRDYFILSKGHACLAYYGILAYKEFLTKDDLDTFEKDESILLGHPVSNIPKGIDFSTGSLGIGIGIGVGLAIGLKKMNSRNQIFVIVGDGECNEGSVWEAMMAASHFKLNNFNLIIDRNNYQQTGKSSEIMNIESIYNKINSFGFDTYEVDGHDPREIYDKLMITNIDRPKALIAQTTKGKYLSFAENNNNFHHTVMTKQLYEESLRELNEI